MMMKILFAAALVVTGCSKKSDTGKAASGPSCGEAVQKAVGAMPAGPGAGDVQAKLQTVMTTRCTEDKWPTEVLTCYATTVTDMASMKKCREILPQDQQQNLMNDIRTVMMSAAAAGGGGPPHGGSAPEQGSAAEPATGSN
jgi:hypothetical protein